MNDKVRRLKNAYSREVAEINAVVSSREFLLSFLSSEIKKELGDKAKEISFQQMEATQKLVAFMEGKLKKFSEIRGSLYEKTLFAEQIKEVDVFFQKYPFIAVMFDNVLKNDTPEQQALKNAVITFKSAYESQDNSDENEFQMKP